MDQIARAPTDEEIAEILERIHAGITRLLRRVGRLPDEPGPTDPVAEQMPLLAGYAAASINELIATGPRAGHPVRRLRSAAAVVDAQKLRCARLEGFPLHANVALEGHAREQLAPRSRLRSQVVPHWSRQGEPCGAGPMPAPTVPAQGLTPPSGSGRPSWASLMKRVLPQNPGRCEAVFAAA
jgi:hypothetical protein